MMNERVQSGNPLIGELEQRIERYAQVEHYVMITGERGTGKTTIAKRLHRSNSMRSQKAFVNLNCATLTEELLESELFGYEKGAFTGALAAKAGLFEAASGGTVFLDEIGELPFALQAKLLKAVEEKKIRRIGSSIERPIDVRIISATSRNLKKMAAEGLFRPDLLDRLNILALETVPLRFQRERIREVFIEKLNAERAGVGRKGRFKVSIDALSVLENLPWPGNFRELANFAVRIAVECAADEMIGRDRVETVLRGGLNSPPPNSDHTVREESETSATNYPENLVTVSFDPDRDDLKSVYLKAAGNFIRHHLSENNGNLRKTARVMGTTHTTLSRIMKKYEKNLGSAAADSNSVKGAFAASA
jgi:sigma-54 dependent transcriptional regulator, flagellar regulatory protein